MMEAMPGLKILGFSKLVMLGQLGLILVIFEGSKYICLLTPWNHNGWRLGVVVSIVGRINEVNQHRARLVHDG